MTALTITLPVRLDDTEREIILHTLEHFDGHKLKSAQALGISLKTLYNKLHEYEARGLYFPDVVVTA